jgi:NADH:ubiquinone oxidoreductase subunit E
MALSVEEIRSETRKIVEPWRDGKGGLIPILQAVQNQMGYLPGEALAKKTDATNRSAPIIFILSASP